MIRIRRAGRRLALALALLWAAVLQPLRAEQLSLHEYGHEEGLDNLAVRAVVQDAEGYLWAGSENGLYRFDGQRFRRVDTDRTLSNISALAVQGEGLWVGTGAGLWRWQGGRLVPVSPADSPFVAIDVSQALAPAVDGSLWVVADYRLYRVTQERAGGWRFAAVFDEAALSAEPALRDVLSVLALPDGDLWFGCAKGLCRRRGKLVERFGPEQGVPPAHWDRLLRASDGSLWARGGRHVLQWAPGAAGFVQREDASFVDDEAGHYPLDEDAQHRILTATRGALLRWDGGRWERFDAASGLAFPGRLAGLLPDREGGLWLAALGAGVLQWRGYGWWQNWSTADGLPHAVVWRILRAGPADGGALYVGTGQGVAVLDPQAGRFRALASDATGATDVSALAFDPQGTLWAGTWGGRLVGYPRPVRRGTVRWALPEGEVAHELLPDGTDLTVVGSRTFYRWRPGASAAQPAEPPVPAKGDVLAACVDPAGGLWAAAYGAYLLHRDDAGWHSMLTQGDPGALACLRDGSVLLADDGGLHRITPGDKGPQQQDLTPPLLQGRKVQALLEDRRGWWWVATDAGVAVSNGAHWRLLDQREGLVWNDTSGSALQEDSDGSIWIGTSRGVSHLIAPEKLFIPVSGKVTIEAVRSGGRPLALAKSFSLPWSRETLEVALSAPVYRLRSAAQLEYRLVGFDERWTAVPGGLVRLAGLQAGRYRFEARLVDRDIGTASQATGFDFAIEPPWWQTGTARALLVAAALALVLLAHRWRLRRVTQRSSELEAMVRQRTQELEASQEQLRELATRDGLTGAWNRRALMEILEREVVRAQREQVPLTLVMADIDHFKRINDGFGHPAGDAVLREFVSRLSSQVRSYDAVGRYGGEEFVLVLPGLDMSRAEDRSRLGAIHFGVCGAPMPAVGAVTCSFGAATQVPGAALGVEQLIAAADEALYRAKHNGRNRVEYAQDREDAAVPS